MITISLYRNCYSVFLRRKRHYSGALQVHERHSVWCKIAHHEDAEHNVCAPVLGRMPQLEKRGRLGGAKGGVYVHTVIY